MCQNSFFLNFHFFHRFKLDLVKMAKLACDQLCQHMWHLRYHFASADGACLSMLLAYAAHTVANCQRRRRIRQQNRVKMSFCKRMCSIRLQIASLCSPCGSTLLAYAAHAVATCQRMRVQIAIVDGTCGRKLLAYAVANCQRTRRLRQQNRVKLCVLLAQTAHAVALCQRMRHMRQQSVSVDGAYGSNLLAQTAHAVAKTKWLVSHPSVKNVKILFQPSSPLPIETS